MVASCDRPAPYTRRRALSRLAGAAGPVNNPGTAPCSRRCSPGPSSPSDLRRRPSVGGARCTATRSSIPPPVSTARARSSMRTTSGDARTLGACRRSTRSRSTSSSSTRREGERAASEPCGRCGSRCHVPRRGLELLRASDRRARLRQPRVLRAPPRDAVLPGRRAERPGRVAPVARAEEVEALNLGRVRAVTVCFGVSRIAGSPCTRGSARKTPRPSPMNPSRTFACRSRLEPKLGGVAVDVQASKPLEAHLLVDLVEAAAKAAGSVTSTPETQRWHESRQRPRRGWRSAGRRGRRARPVSGRRCRRHRPVLEQEPGRARARRERPYRRRRRLVQAGFEPGAEMGADVDDDAVGFDRARDLDGLEQCRARLPPDRLVGRGEVDQVDGMAVTAPIPASARACLKRSMFSGRSGCRPPGARRTCVKTCTDSAPRSTARSTAVWIPPAVDTWAPGCAAQRYPRSVAVPR